MSNSQVLDFSHCPLPPLPPATLAPRPSLLPFLPDHHLPYVVPAIVYWLLGLTFHYVDTKELLSAYKLHTPAEYLKKNRASRRDVVKFALIQQAAQCIFGYYMADDTELFYPASYGIATWARRIRQFECLVSPLVHLLGFGMGSVKADLTGTKTTLGAKLIQESSGICLNNATRTACTGANGSIAAYSSWEWAVAEMIYSIIVPLLQFLCGMVLADTFQYFTHRAFHVNKWLYKHIHSMHHDVYVPFAYGAFYNHPLETIPIDSIGFPICLAIAGLNNRQAALFGAIWTFKTVVDHCGYDFPYNPCNIICPNSVYFHDLHHQTWGMKYNFSVYASFWDRVMGTYWASHDSKAQEKYARGRKVAEESLAKNRSAEKALKAEALETDAGFSTAREL